MRPAKGKGRDVVGKKGWVGVYSMGEIGIQEYNACEEKKYRMSIGEAGGPIDQFLYEDIRRLADRYSEWC